MISKTFPADNADKRKYYQRLSAEEALLFLQPVFENFFKFFHFRPDNYLAVWL